MRLISSRIGYVNPWITIREDTLEYADGTTSMFGVVVKNDFALVVPAEKDGFWLVRQWRHTAQRMSWEFPMGGWPPGFTGDRSDVAALARAELREETGIAAGQLRHVGRLAPNIGLVEQSVDVWLASDLRFGEPDPEASEEGMEHAFFTRPEFTDLIRAGDMFDAQSLAAYALVQLRG